MPPGAVPTASRIDDLVASAMPRIVEVTRDMEFDTFQTAARIPRDLRSEPETGREQFRWLARTAEGAEP